MASVLFEKKTNFGNIQIVEDKYYDERMCRFLLVNGSMESAMYLEESKPNELVFPYMTWFGYPYAIRPELKKTLLIGGGCFSYPKFYVSHYDDKEIHAIEISQDIIECAKKYFKIDEAVKEFGSRFQIIHDNGASFLNKTEETYDVIINDAFIGNKPFGYDEDTVLIVKKHLNTQGVYMLNTVTAAKGLRSWRGKEINKLLSKHFENVLMLLCDDENDLYHSQNILFLASDGSLDLPPEQL